MMKRFGFKSMAQSLGAGVEQPSVMPEKLVTGGFTPGTEQAAVMPGAQQMDMPLTPQPMGSDVPVMQRQPAVMPGKRAPMPLTMGPESLPPMSRSMEYTGGMERAAVMPGGMMQNMGPGSMGQAPMGKMTPPQVLGSVMGAKPVMPTGMPLRGFGAMRGAGMPLMMRGRAVRPAGASPVQQGMQPSGMTR